MNNQQIWYEPHPCSPQRKAELRAQGFVILDALYAPSDWVAPTGKLPEDEQRAVLIAELNAKGVEFDESLPTDELRALSITDPDANKDGKVTAAELKAALTAAGVAFKSNASKAELQALYDGIGK